MPTDPWRVTRSMPGRDWPVAIGPTTQPAAPSVVSAWGPDPRPFHLAALLLHDAPQVQRRRRTLLDSAPDSYL